MLSIEGFKASTEQAEMSLDRAILYREISHLRKVGEVTGVLVLENNRARAWECLHAPQTVFFRRTNVSVIDHEDGLC